MQLITRNPLDSQDPIRGPPYIKTDPHNLALDPEDSQVLASDPTEKEEDLQRIHT